MTDHDLREITRLALAVEAQGVKLGDVSGDIKAIVQWTKDRKQICDRHETTIEKHGEKIGELGDEVTRGLSRQTLIAGVISATIVGLAIGIPLWLRFSAAIAASRGG